MALNYYPLLAAPLITLLTLLYVFHKNEMYPFGGGSVAWCDMNQQVVPFLMNLKDLLNGKGDLFLNMQNAGGMGFYGVFCFFLSSPLSLMVAFADKANMLLFVNIMVIVKLTLAALTGTLFFVRRRPNLGRGFATAFGVMYALGGYGMLFYQNIMWLDILILFPVLIIGLEKLVTEGRNLGYTLALTAVMLANFYIGYMVAVFILVYMGLYMLSFRKKGYRPDAGLKFVIGSLLAALLSAVVWLPSFLQVGSSGRLKSLEESLTSASFLTSYQTVLPLLFCSAFLLPAVLIRLGESKRLSMMKKHTLLLFAMTLVPFFIEPINLMWHTGNYMSFPARYGFMTMFVGLMCSADLLEQNENDKKPIGPVPQIAASVLMMVMTYFYATKADSYITEHFGELTNYTTTLWGNSTSFDRLARLYVFSAACYGILLLCSRKKLLGKPMLAVLLTVFCVFEAAGNIRIYMVSPAQNNPVRTENYLSVTELCDKIDDDDFYRVGTDYSGANYNMIGALGYPSLSHYSSLTGHDYMTMQRMLGYSTVWMKSGGNGGTELTNALYSVKYKISGSTSDKNIYYTTGRRSIVSQSFYTGLGLVTNNKLKQTELHPDTDTRASVQQRLFENVFDTKEKLITEYPYDTAASRGIRLDNHRYILQNGAVVSYTIQVKGKQSLYADCYDTFSHKLKEDYFESMDIRANYGLIKANYPSADNNGLVFLGEFEDETVTVSISLKKQIDVHSFGVFGLDHAVLQKHLDKAQSVGFKESNGRLTGKVDAQKGQTCFMALPYNEGLKIRINGEEVPYRCVFTDFVAFELKDGTNQIEISLTPKGFVPGLIITLCGMALLIGGLVFLRKWKAPKWLIRAGELCALFAAVLGILLIYVMPMIMII